MPGDSFNNRLQYIVHVLPSLRRDLLVVRSTHVLVQLAGVGGREEITYHYDIGGRQSERGLDGLQAALRLRRRQIDLVQDRDNHQVRVERQVKVRHLRHYGLVAK